MKYTYIFIIVLFVKTHPILARELDYKNDGNSSLDNFSLQCNIKGNYTGYIYLKYDAEIDSCLIKDNTVLFKGHIKQNSSTAIIFLNKENASYVTVFLEKNNIAIDLEIKEKNLFNIKDVIILSILKVTGSDATKILLDYKDFVSWNSEKIDLQQQLFEKVNTIIIQNPHHQIGGYLLRELSKFEKSDKEKLKQLYKKLDKNNTSEKALKVIEGNLYPEKHLEINDFIYDFELPDRNSITFKTKSLKGKWFLVDFWASWCSPCRKQIPDLKNIYTKYNKTKEFEIVSVSIDTDRQKWLNALEKENLAWPNIIDTKGFDGAIEQKYNILSIPSNFLINPEGKIIFKNIEPEALDKFLEKL